MSTILIVDDNPTARQVMKTILKSDAYTLVFAHDGSTALDYAASLTPDLLLLDVMMPDMDGFEVCRRIRDTPLLTDIPIIMVTALDDRESRIQGILVGADDFVSKPVDPMELRARVQTITRLNRYRRLMAERLKFERVSELSPNGILVVDSEGIILMANPTLMRMACVEAEHTLVGLDVRIFFEPDQHYRYLEALQRVLADPDHVDHFEAVWLRLDDSRFPAEVDSGYIEWDTTPAVQMVVRDISERVQLEAMAVEKERFAANSILSATVAHEVNTPLHTIKTCLYLADSTDEEQRTTYLKLAQDEIDRISHILRQLLDLYRTHNGPYVPLDANTLIQRMLVLTSNIFSQKGITSRCSLQPNLGYFAGRPDQLTQILLNLTLNAVAAMPQGGALTFTTREQYDEETDRCAIVIQVADTGIGIAPDVQSRIFEPFFTTKEDGSGLGLAVCQRLVHEHHGMLTVESSPGDGSTFTLTFPKAEELDEE